MGSFDAVIFDLYETLVTEFDPTGDRVRPPRVVSAYRT